MNHFNGIRRYLQEAERESDCHGGAFCGIPAHRQRAENHRVNAGDGETVPYHLVICVFTEFLFNNDHGSQQRKRPEHFLAADLLDFVERLDADGQHCEAYEEGIAVGQVIGEVEAVEGKIGPVVRHQQDQDTQQTAEGDTRSQSDPAAGEEDGDQQHSQHRAIDIRQIVAAFGGRIAEKRAGENIPEIEIAGHLAGKFIFRTRGFPERNGSRHKNPHGEHTADSRRPNEAKEILDICQRLVFGRKTGKTGVVFKCAHDVPQHQEYADHVADVVVGGDGHSEGDAVEQRTFTLHNLFQPVDDQGQQYEAIQPHHVPRIGDEVGVESIGDGECDCAVIILFEYAAAEYGKGRSGGGDFQHFNKRDGLGEVVPRE